MFTVHLTNIPAAAVVEAATYEAAIEHGKSTGFEFNVQQDGRILCGFDLFRGLIVFEDPTPVCVVRGHHRFSAYGFQCLDCDYYHAAPEQKAAVKPAQLMGRLANGFERGRGRVVHLVPHDCPDYGHATALCGSKPGRRSGGWDVENAREATCPRCLRRLQARAIAELAAAIEAQL